MKSDRVGGGDLPWVSLIGVGIDDADLMPAGCSTTRVPSAVCAGACDAALLTGG